MNYDELSETELRDYLNHIVDQEACRKWDECAIEFLIKLVDKLN
jgi:hypothetical protein